ncbi:MULTISPECIES: ATP-binding cassette domain-containing protein [Micromonospora]|nr:ATP-binding cassette domain-containing protein [Micromonospora yangpuensis]GGM05851.1 ABC transporter [Micromonospora yangpuensis]
MIEADGLARTFQAAHATVDAVRGLSFQVATGEIVGFLGPNGAGKTTTLRMLTTLLRPTSGRAVVAGHDLVRGAAQVRRNTGYVAQSGGTDGTSLVLEELVLQARLYRFSRAEATRRAGLLVRQLDLTGLERRQIRTLSGGQRRRLDLALGLVHEPRLLFLDEPTVGLDPQSRANLWDHVRRLRDDLATTVFLTTHYLDEADALCDRLLVIDDGRIVADGSPEELKRRVGGDVVTVSVDGDAERAAKLLAAEPGIGDLTVTGRTLRLALDTAGEQALLPLLRVLDAAGIAALSVQISRPTLDDVFLGLTGRSLREPTPDAPR